MERGIDPLTLDDAWERLRTHVEWSEDFWVVFVFTNDFRVVDELNLRLQTMPSVRHRRLRCAVPDQVEEHIIQPLLKRDGADISWVDFVRFDDGEGKPGWGDAWALLLSRLNERREHLRRRLSQGGIVFATTLDRLDSSPGHAPDLWTIRSLVLPIEGLPRALSNAPTPSLDTPPPALRSSSPHIALARQAVRSARASGDTRTLVAALTRLADVVTEEDALAPRSEAIALLRELVEASPSVENRYSLLHALVDLSIDLSALGRHEQALEASRESLSYCRALAQERPDAFLPDLGANLNNLAMKLSELGEREAALDASREAVDIRRWLAEVRPSAFLPDLATSLNNLSTHLSALGEPEAALDAVCEAVEIRRRLVEARPDAFLDSLATSLDNLGNTWSTLGTKRGAALDATREAVDLYRKLVQANPDAFLPGLAKSLNNLGVRFSDLGEPEAALDTTREATDLYRQLVQARPDAFLPYLAGSLNNLSNDLSALDRHGAAIDASSEAIDLYRQLTETRPNAYLPDLARALWVRGDILLAIGQPGHAAKSFAEGIRATSPLLKSQPYAVKDLYSALLHGYASACEAAGIEPAEDLAQHLLSGKATTEADD